VSRTFLAACLAAALGVPGAAAAQILGGGGLPSLPSGGFPSIGAPMQDLPRPSRPAVPRPPANPSLPKVDPTATVGEAVDTARELTGAALTDVRRLTAQKLIRDHPGQVEADEHGAPVVRGEILALSPSPAALARAQQAGFGVRPNPALDALGLQAVTLTAPRGLSAIEAVRRLRALDPEGQYDFDHLYQEAGAVERPGGRGTTTDSGGSGGGVRVGLIDGAVATGQPALGRARLVQRAFAPGGARVTAHATAVASLLAGNRGAFRGAAPGATVMAADVYGPTPAGGSAEAIARALAWMAETRTAVVNISLVGPPNLVLGAAVKALVARGYVLVAAVGNDGPAAAALYPAAYPGVVAVTGVDDRRRVLPEAGRGTHVDFAAPGAQMAACGVDGGFVAVRGTSFAAPIVAGELARRLSVPDRDGAARALAQLGREAADLGAPGPDPVYGRGLVGFDLRTDPAAVSARASTLRGP
jgi:hypothetical protein